jgi:hypothetical protein
MFCLFTGVLIWAQALAHGVSTASGWHAYRKAPHASVTACSNNGPSAASRSPRVGEGAQQPLERMQNDRPSGFTTASTLAEQTD